MFKKKHRSITAWFVALIVLISIVFSKTVTYASDDISGDFTDTNFKQSVWEWLGHTGTPGNFSKQDLIDRMPAQVYMLDVSRWWVPENLKISSLNGFEHFQGTGLKEFYCYANHIASLPELPDTLEVLRCEANSLESLPALPESLIQLLCSNNNKLVLTTLPQHLEIFDCSGCNLKSLPELPVSLIDLDCALNQLTSLPPLPAGLKYLYCIDNIDFDSGKTLSTLPDLPDGLTRLAVDGNGMTELPELPDSLEILNCPYNRLTTLPDLPDGLLQLCVEGNLLTELPDLPDSLELFYCGNNKLTSLTDLPITLKLLSCERNYLDVFSDPLLTQINNCTAEDKTLTPQYRYTFTGSDKSLNIGESSSLIATDFLQQQSTNGTEWTNTGLATDLSNFTFSSSDPTVATVNSDGLINATGNGSCEIYADFAGVNSKLTRMAIPVNVAASILVAGFASDSFVYYQNDDLSIGDRVWEIYLTSGTLKGTVGDDLTNDIAIEGLPAGLTWTAETGNPNHIRISLSGEAITPLVDEVIPVAITVKGSAVSESGASSSNPISVIMYPFTYTTLVLSNEESGLIDDLIESGYGDGSLYDALLALQAASGGVISDVFLEILAGCPAGSEIFTSKLSDYTGLNNPVGINSDGTVIIVPIFGRDYYGKDGYLTYPENPMGSGREIFTYAKSPLNYIDSGSSIDSFDGVNSTGNYIVFAIAWSPADLIIAGTASDSSVTMKIGNKSVLSSDNTWSIDVITGTLKGTTGDDLTENITVTGLPDGLTWTAKKGSSNKLILTVSGIAVTALTIATTVSIILKRSAVTETGAADSAPINVQVTPDTATTFVLSNEEGKLIDKLIEDGYGDCSLYQVLEYLQDKSGMIISDEFLEVLAALPAESEIFTAALKNYTGVNNPVCINTDGTVRVQPIFAKTYHGKEGYNTYPDSQTGTGRESFTYATSPEFYIDAGSGWSNDNETGRAETYYKAFAIAWIPLEPTTTDDTGSNGNQQSVSAPTTSATATPLVTPEPTTPTATPNPTSTPVTDEFSTQVQEDESSLTIEEEPIPEAPIAVSSESQPDSTAALPKTGGIPAVILYGTGFVIVSAGVYMVERKKDRI